MPSILERLQFMREAWGASKQIQDTSGPHGLLHGILRSGHPPKRGTRELMAAYKHMPWLRSVTSRISTAIASTTWELYVENGRNGRAVRNLKAQRGDPLQRRETLKRLKQQGTLREIENHPLLDLIDNANPIMTGRTARQVTQTYLDLKGEAFWIMERNGQGMPIELWPVPPHWIIDVPYLGQPFFRVNFQGWQGVIPQTEVVWLKDPDPENPYARGAGIAEALSDELETDEYAAKHTKAWFYNRATPDILVGIQGAGEDQLRAAKQKWENEHKGFFKAFRSHWHSGKMDVVQLSQTFADQQLISLREFERNTIVQVFGCPPEVVGIIDNSNRATIEAADYLFTRWVLTPRLELLRSEMQERLVPEFDERLILDYVSPIPEDREYKLNVARAAPWSVTVNEWREMQELEPVPAGNVFRVPLNLMPERAGRVLPEMMPESEEEPAPSPAREPEETEERGHKRKAQKRVLPDDILVILDALRPEYLTRELDSIFRELVEAWGNQTLLQIGIEPSFNMLNPLVENHLREKSTVKIQGLVNETTRERLRASLMEGVQAGESIPSLARRVSETFAEAKGPRATTIARTEVLTSSNFATFEAFEQSGVVDVKEWLATQDDRVRDTHAVLDGQQQALQNPFVTINGDTTMHPGGFGIAEEDINCRCTVIPVIADVELAAFSPEQRTALWKQFDRELIPWERRVERALKRGFQTQENEAIRALNKIREEG